MLPACRVATVHEEPFYFKKRVQAAACKEREREAKQWDEHIKLHGALKVKSLEYRGKQVACVCVKVHKMTLHRAKDTVKG